MTFRDRPVVVIALWTALALLVIPVYQHFPSPNEFTRWALAVAVVEHGTIEITNVAPLFGRSMIEDVSIVNGRMYSNKAPGVALLTIPAYAIAQLFAGPASGETMRPTLTAMRWVGATLPVLLLALVFVRVARRFGADDERITFALFVLLFATPLFAYGLLLFSHAFTAAALFGAWALLFVNDRPRARGVALAGLLLGAAAISEYPVAIAGAVIACCALPQMKRSHIALLIAGGALPLAILALYNKSAFGSPLTLGSGFEADPAYRRLAATGLFGIGFPSPLRALQLLFDPSKGLLVLSPVLLLAGRGLAPLRRLLPPPALVAAIGAPVTLLLVYAGYPNWHGGWTVGARYLVPALPFVLLAVVMAPRHRADAALTGASALAVTVTTLAFPFVPPDFAAPWFTFGGHLLRFGHSTPTLLDAVHLPRALTIAVPFLLVIASCAVTFSRRQIAAATAGALLMLAAGVLVSRISPAPLRARMALVQIEAVYFGDDDAADRDLPPTLRPGPGYARYVATARSSPPPPLQ